MELHTDIEEIREVNEQFHSLIVPHWRGIIAEYWGEYWSVNRVSAFLKNRYGQKVDRTLCNTCRSVAFDFFNYNIPFTVEENRAL